MQAQSQTVLSSGDAPPYAGATVSLTALVPFVRFLEDTGPDAVRYGSQILEEHLARWGIAMAELDGPTTRLPHALVINLLGQFTTVLGDASSAARAALKLQSGDYELLEYLCTSSATLGQAIQCLSHYYPLLISADLSLHVRGDDAELRFRIAPGLEASNAVHEYGMVSNFVMTAWHLQMNEHVQPARRVTFTHPRPEHAGLLAELFSCPVQFGAEHNTIVFPVAMLAHPMKSADAALHNVLIRLADQELKALFERSAFPAMVRKAIIETLDRGAALEDVASTLKMSPNTLRSRLRQYGTTYSSLLDHYRRDYAKRALRQTQLSIAEVGHRLGFSHPPAFNRAFKRWFGMAPNAYRNGESAPISERLIHVGDRSQ